MRAEDARGSMGAAKVEYRARKFLQIELGLQDTAQDLPLCATVKIPMNETL